MKKIILILLALQASAVAFAGQITFKSMYVTNTIVQGTGETYEAAVEDALATIPDTFQSDPMNGQAIECTVSESMLRSSNGEKCDTSIEGNLYRITIPVISRTSQ